MLAEKKIKKHVAIIHAYSLMSVLQRKIFNVLLYEAIKNNQQSHANDHVAIECQMPLQSLQNIVKFNSNNTQYVKEAIDHLASLTIEWNLLKDKIPNSISFLNLRVLHGSPTFYQNGTFNFSFHKIMLDLVSNPLIYGTIDLELQSQFDSKYSHALYENCTRFVNLKKNKIIQLDVFKKLLGVEDNKYTSFREFSRNVIVTALEEVNERADFTVNLKKISSGRKVTGFELLVKNKKPSTKIVTHHENPTPSNHQCLLDEIKANFGMISPSILASITHQYPENYIHEKILYTKTHVKKTQTGLYPIAYFISALKKDYQSSKKLVSTIQSEAPEQTEWKVTFLKLESDLKHWQKLLDIAHGNKRDDQVKNIEKIILQCKDKFDAHLLSEPLTKELA